MATSGYGALAGFGAGLASVGAGMAREAEQERELRNRMRLQDLRSDDAMELARYRAGLGPGGRGGGSQSPAMGALAILSDPAAFAQLSGLDRAEVDDYLSMSRGAAPTETRTMGPERFTSADRAAEAEPITAEAAKYTPGQAADLRKRAVMGLREAMKVANPAQADDISKSQLTDTQRQFTEQHAETGDEMARRGALLAAGKDPSVGDAAEDTADARMVAAKQPRGSRSGGGGGGGSTIQRTLIDDSGNVIAVMRDGTTKPLGIKAGEFGKRVDSLAAKLAKTIEFMGKPMAEVRAEAERQIAGSSGTASAPAPASRPPLSSFRK